MMPEVPYRATSFYSPCLTPPIDEQTVISTSPNVLAAVFRQNVSLAQEFSKCLGKLIANVIKKELMKGQISWCLIFSGVCLDH